MTKADLIRAIHFHLGSGVSMADIDRVLVASGAVVTDTLQNGGNVTLPGLGSLKTVQRAARTGRNPRTGTALDIPACKVAKFTASKALKDALQ